MNFHKTFNMFESVSNPNPITIDTTVWYFEIINKFERDSKEALYAKHKARQALLVSVKQSIPRCINFTNHHYLQKKMT
jgi:hypothetical protein